MTHESIWRAIDSVAKKLGVTPSGLAKLCDLNPTSFNKSKRVNKYGQLRWPCVSTLAKVIQAAGISDQEFFEL